MSDVTGEPRLSIARAATISGATLLILTSAALGSLYGYTVGAAHGGAILGGILAAAALGGELLKPFAIAAALDALTHWRPIRAAACLVLGAVCVVYSLASELSLAAGSRGDLAATRASEATKATRADASYRRLEAELAALPPARPSGELRALVAGIDALPGIVVNGEPCGGVANGPMTREHCPRRAALVAELERAAARERLAGELRKADKTQASNGPTLQADPLASALAVYAAAAGWRITADELAPWLALLPVALLEFGSSLGVVLVRVVSEPAAAARNTGSAANGGTGRLASAAGGDAVSGTTTDDDPGGPSGGVRLVSGEPVRRDNVTAIRKWIAAHGGEATTSVRRLAADLGLPRSTAHDELRRAADAGLIRVEAGRKGLRLAVA